MATERELKLASEMRKRVKRLRNLDYPEKKLERLIKKLNLPLGLQMNLLNTR